MRWNTSKFSERVLETSLTVKQYKRGLFLWEPFVSISWTFLKSSHNLYLIFFAINENSIFLGDLALNGIFNQFTDTSLMQIPVSDGKIVFCLP